MRLYQRRKRSGERVWWASWTAGGVTVRRSTRCATKQAAEIVVARWERELADPVYAAASSATFGVEAGLFVRACESAMERGKIAPGTLTMYRQKAGTLVRLLGADLRLAEIDGSTFPGYIDTRRATFAEETATDENPEGKRITESTLYKEWVTFRGIMRQARRARRFGHDPSSLKPDHFGPDYQPKKTALSWEQVDALLGALTFSRRAPVAYVLMSGARRSEVFVAQAGDVDDRAWTVKLRGTKTEGSARTIPIPQPMRRLWRSLGNGAPFAPWPNARRGLARACKRAGVPVVTWNDLRRTYASLLVQSGVDVAVVARLLGHTTPTLAYKTYGQQTTESLADLLKRQLKTKRRREPLVNQTRPSQAAAGRPGGHLN